jgi:hypothetical protein
MASHNKERLEWAVRHAVRTVLRRGQRAHLCALVDHDVAWLSHWLRGYRRIDLDEMATICDHLGLDLPTILRVAPRSTRLRAS